MKSVFDIVKRGLEKIGVLDDTLIMIYDAREWRELLIVMTILSVLLSVLTYDGIMAMIEEYGSFFVLSSDTVFWIWAIIIDVFCYLITIASIIAYIERKNMEVEG